MCSNTQSHLGAFLSTEALMVMHVPEVDAGGRRLGTQPAHLSHLSGGLRLLLLSWLLNCCCNLLLPLPLVLLERLVEGPGTSESVEKPETSSSVSSAAQQQSCTAYIDSEPRERESGSGGSTLLIDVSGARRPLVTLARAKSPASLVHGEISGVGCITCSVFEKKFK